jgi:hypothetical protein
MRIDFASDKKETERYSDQKSYLNDFVFYCYPYIQPTPDVAEKVSKYKIMPHRQSGHVGGRKNIREP